MYLTWTPVLNIVLWSSSMVTNMTLRVKIQPDPSLTVNPNIWSHIDRNVKKSPVPPSHQLSLDPCTNISCWNKKCSEFYLFFLYSIYSAPHTTRCSHLKVHERATSPPSLLVFSLSVWQKRFWKLSVCMEPVPTTAKKPGLLCLFFSLGRHTSVHQKKVLRTFNNISNRSNPSKCAKLELLQLRVNFTVIEDKCNTVCSNYLIYLFS